VTASENTTKKKDSLLAASSSTSPPFQGGELRGCWYLQKLKKADNSRKREDAEKVHDERDGK